VPRHGFVVGGGGLGGSETIVVDYDGLTLRYISDGFLGYPGELPKVDRTFRVAQASVEKLRALAVAAAHEEPHGVQPAITDVGEDFYAIDGNRHVAIAGTMFDTSAFGEPAWRPIAGRLLAETFELARSLAAFP
jgi:hypothetical protein